MPELESHDAIALRFDELIAMGMHGARSILDDPTDSLQHGDLRGRRRGHGLDFENVGPYQPGDDIRHIEWHATARTGRPQVKRFRVDIQQPVMILVDARGSMFFGTHTQLMAKTACLAGAFLALRHSPMHQALGWMMLGDDDTLFLPPEQGRRRRLRQFRQLVVQYNAQCALTGDRTVSPTLGESLRDAPARIRADAQVVLISDFSALGDDAETGLRELRPQRLSAVIVEDALWRGQLAPGTYPLRRAGQALPSRTFIGRDRTLVQAAIDTERQRLDEFLHDLGVRQITRCDAQSLRRGTLL